MGFLTSFTLAGNELWRYLAVFMVLLVSLVVGRLMRYVLEKKARELAAGVNREFFNLFLGTMGKPVVLLAFAAGFQISMTFLHIPAEMQDIVNTISRTLFTIAVAYLIYRSIDILDVYLNRLVAKTESKIDDMLVPMVRKSLRVTIVIVVGLLIAESLSGKPISTLLAGLGIGGLAVALAAQDSIKNLFGSFVILTDKPFEAGDRIIIEGNDGYVEEVGFRSTKIRTLDGHLVTLPNSQVANSAIINIGKRPYIRRLTNITITYDTPLEKIQRAVEIIKEILNNHEGMNPELPPRVYFNEFNDTSLNIIMIYWYHPPNYWDFLAFNQKVNLEIFRRFTEEGIEFAFPTQTIYLANDDRRQLALRILEGQTRVD